MPALAEALDALIDANSALRKRRALAPLERTLETAMGKAFRKQGRAFLRNLAPLEGRFAPAPLREAPNEGEWSAAFADAAQETADDFAAPIDAAATAALESGMAAAVLDLAIDAPGFDLSHPRAVAYLRDHGLGQAKRIDETTRARLRTLLARAADEGWSYNRTAKAIRSLYADFSATRARNIAQFETGDGYEHGNLSVARDLQDGGIEMEKSWLSARDEKTRPDHLMNDNAGWIDLDSPFPSGHDRPPTDPRCRCSAGYRRKPTE